MTDVVHSKGSYIFSQLWALGRSAEPDVLAQEGLEYVGASDIPITGKVKPRALTTAGTKYLQPHEPLSLIFLM